MNTTLWYPFIFDKGSFVFLLNSKYISTIVKDMHMVKIATKTPTEACTI